jgi:hypothetical protein
VDAKEPLVAALVAIGICAVNTLLGYVVARKAFGKELNTFLSMVFGSLGIRSLFVITAAWYCLSIAKMHQVAFALTFAIACFVMLLGEILFFHHWFELSKRQVRLPVSDLLKKNGTERLTIDLALAW